MVVGIGHGFIAVVAKEVLGHYVHYLFRFQVVKVYPVATVCGNFVMVEFAWHANKVKAVEARMCAAQGRWVGSK